MNIGAKIVKEDNIIFVDNDIWSKDPKWLKKIRDKLIQHERKVVHGFFVSQDTEDPRLNYQSLGSVNMFDAETDLDVNPGLCWGITKRFFDSMAGINPFFVDGGGDSGFVCEYLNTPEKTYDSYLFRFDWYQKIYRNMGVKGMLDCVDSDIIHQNHGKFASRNYNTIRYAIDELKDDIQKFCRKDKQGLLEWVDPECAERRIMKRRPEMFDNEIMKEIVKSEYK
jgi:glycosyltransferase involved in cell wall biosynthesis